MLKPAPRHDVKQSHKFPLNLIREKVADKTRNVTKAAATSGVEFIKIHKLLSEQTEITHLKKCGNK